MRMRRALQQTLAMYPAGYARLLRAFNRGSSEKRLFLTTIQRGDVVFDVGANEGYFTLLFFDIVGAGGRVHAFEPIPPTFERLARRIRQEAASENVRLFNGACSDQEGVATMVVPGDDPAQASLATQQAGEWARSTARTAHTVQTIRLDEYVADNRCSRINVLKCDAEGAELLVLRGMGAALTQLRPLLSLEVNQAWTPAFNYEPIDLVRWLATSGYDLMFALQDRLRPVSPEQAARLAAEDAGLNLLCASRSVHSERLARIDYA